MEVAGVERIDHYGIVAGVIKETGLVEIIDARIGVHREEKISTGEAVAGMIINGLGFTDRPLSLVPQFFNNCPVALLFRDGVSAEDFNRFKLGRALDELHAYGNEALFAEIAMSLCRQEDIDTRFGQLDTTSFSLTGEYREDSDEHAIKVVHGYSKDHRPDLKQVVLELMVTQDGGIPIVSKVWDGNTSDNEIFKKRTKALLDEFRKGEGPKVLVADSKLYSKDHAETLRSMAFVTRIPDNVKLVQETMDQALIADVKEWDPYDEKRRYKVFAVEHYGISQRWIVVYSQAARDRVKATIARRTEKEKEAIAKELFHLHAQRFACKPDAEEALARKAKKWRYHVLASSAIGERPHFKGRGRPKPGKSPGRIEYQITATAAVNEKAKLDEEIRGACFVIGTNVAPEAMSAKDVMHGYFQQQEVERGFRFLKDPVFFAASLFVKKPSRIEGLLMVMTLALLVYAIAERRMRRRLKELGQTIPNQIDEPTQTPTLRWVFQLLDGINRVTVRVEFNLCCFWNGMTDLRRNILKMFGNTVMGIYQISSA